MTTIIQTKHLNLKYSIIFFILILICRNGFTQDQLKYADYLYKDFDYFRAISIYKQILFFTENAEMKNRCLFKIAQAYYKSKRNKASIQYISRLLNQKNLPEWYLPKANIYLGLNYYDLKIYPMVEDYLNKAIPKDTTGFALYYLALLKSEKKQWNEAHSIYLNVHQNYPQSQIGNLSAELSRDVLKGFAIPQKSPLFATLFSTFIPGGGQFYCHHYYDGIQAFLFVSAFSFATIAAYRYDKHFNTNFLSTYFAVSITGIFHLANIIGSRRTAKYYNLRMNEKFMRKIRKKAFSIEN